MQFVVRQHASHEGSSAAKRHSTHSEVAKGSRSNANIESAT